MTLRIPTYPDLAGKVAVVTGSSRGIGAATCRMLAANGAKVVVNGRDEAAVRETVESIRSDGGDVTGFAADAADLDALGRLRAATERVYGPADVLGAFVAGGGPLPGPTAQITEPEWDAALRGNLSVTFLTLKTFLPGMIEREIPHRLSEEATTPRVHLAGCFRVRVVETFDVPPVVRNLDDPVTLRDHKMPVLPRASNSTRKAATHSHDGDVGHDFNLSGSRTNVVSTSPRYLRGHCVRGSGLTNDRPRPVALPR